MYVQTLIIADQSVNQETRTLVVRRNLVADAGSKQLFYETEGLDHLILLLLPLRMYNSFSGDIQAFVVSKT